MTIGEETGSLSKPRVHARPTRSCWPPNTWLAGRCAQSSALHQPVFALAISPSLVARSCVPSRRHQRATETSNGWGGVWSSPSHTRVRRATSADSCHVGHLAARLLATRSWCEERLCQFAKTRGIAQWAGFEPCSTTSSQTKERVRPANHLPSAIGLNAANAETAGRDARHRGGGGGPLQPVWSVDVSPSPSRSGAWDPWFRQHGVSDRVVCNRSALHCIA